MAHPQCWLTFFLNHTLVHSTSMTSTSNLAHIWWWIGSISVPVNYQSRQFYFIATSVPHSTVNQKPLETSPDTLCSIKNQFHIKFMINHISFTSIPPIPISGTQQHLPILLLPLFPKLRILATVFPLFSLHLHFKKNQVLFQILAYLIYFWFLSIPLFPFWLNFAFPPISSLTSTVLVSG